MGSLAGQPIAWSNRFAVVRCIDCALSRWIVEFGADRMLRATPGVLFQRWRRHNWQAWRSPTECGAKTKKGGGQARQVEPDSRPGDLRVAGASARRKFARPVPRSPDTILLPLNSLRPTLLPPSLSSSQSQRLWRSARAHRNSIERYPSEYPPD